MVETTKRRRSNKKQEGTLWHPERTNFIAMKVYARKDIGTEPEVALQDQPDYIGLGVYYTQLAPVAGQNLNVMLAGNCIPVLVEEVGYTAYQNIGDMQPLQVWAKVEDTGHGATHADFDAACEELGLVELRDRMSLTDKGVRYVEVHLVDMTLVNQEAATGIITDPKRAAILKEAILAE